MKQVILFFIGLFFSTVVSAAIWNVDGILDGSDGGFGFSSIHEASGANVMSGTTLTNIIGATGTYDDFTGEVDFDFSLGNGDTLILNGTMFFDGSGWLSGNSSLSYSGLSLAGIGSTGDFGFMPNDVCCGGAYDPNSFVATGVGDLHYMTLWGADGFDLTTGNYSGSTVGMDFRLALSAVPVPAALVLFASGMLGLFGFRRKA